MIIQLNLAMEKKDERDVYDSLKDIGVELSDNSRSIYFTESYLNTDSFVCFYKGDYDFDKVGTTIETIIGNLYAKESPEEIEQIIYSTKRWRYKD